MASHPDEKAPARKSGGVFHLVISKKIRIRGSVTEKRVFLAQGSGIPSSAISNAQDVHCFNIRDLGIEYVGYCDDFGPMNASAIIGFASALQSIIVNHRGELYIIHLSPIVHDALIIGQTSGLLRMTHSLSSTVSNCLRSRSL
jgi:hypothetical protein